MQMDVKDFLSGRFAVGQEKVDGLTAHATLAQCDSQSLANPKELGADFGWKPGQIGGMDIGHHQHMAWIDRLDIHKCTTNIVLIHKTCRGAAGQDVAENAQGRHKSIRVV